MDTKTTINLLLSNGDSGQTVAPNTGGYSYSFNTGGFSASSFFAPLALCLIMVAIGGILLIKRNKHKFSLKNGMIGRVMVVGSVMGLCLLGIFATINKKASVQAIDNKIALTSLSSINTQQKPGEFSYTCDTLTTIDGTPAGYDIYAYVNELNSLKMIDNKDEYFAWTSQNTLSDDTMGYSMESDNLSADSKMVWAVSLLSDELSPAVLTA